MEWECSINEFYNAVNYGIYPFMDLATNGSEVVIKSATELIFIDNTGTIQHRIEFNTEYCESKIMSMSVCDFDNILITGQYTSYDGIGGQMLNYYSHRINSSGTILDEFGYLHINDCDAFRILTRGSSNITMLND